MAWEGLRPLFSVLDDDHFALAGRALQLLEWDRDHQFCGRCGTPTEAKRDERVRVCPACKLSAYPRVAPAVMALVQDGKRDPARRAARTSRPACTARSPASSSPASRSSSAWRAKSPRKSACASSRRALLREPAVAVSALADDRVRLRVGERRDPAASRRNRGRELVRSIAIAETSKQNLDRSQIDRRSCRRDRASESKRDLGGFERVERDRRALCAARREWKAWPGLPIRGRLRLRILEGTEMNGLHLIGDLTGCRCDPQLLLDGEGFRAKLPRDGRGRRPHDHGRDLPPVRGRRLHRHGGARRVAPRDPHLARAPGADARRLRLQLQRRQLRQGAEAVRPDRRLLPARRDRAPRGRPRRAPADGAAQRLDRLLHQGRRASSASGRRASRRWRSTTRRTTASSSASTGST